MTEFVGRVTRMGERLYIEIPKNKRQLFGDLDSGEPLHVKVTKVLGKGAASR